MYAITHAATALAVKRRYPDVPLWPLLIAAQAVELLWVVFTYLGVEHVSVTPDAVHLDFLPYSHSVATAMLLAALGLATLGGGKRRALGVAVALAIVSHVLLDIVQHEPDIALLPLAWGPRLGLGLARAPLVDLLVETAYGVACWWVYGGTGGLLAGIVAFNLLDAPFMFPRRGSLAPIAAHPAILTTIILGQIVTSWLLVGWLGRRRSGAPLGSGVEVPARARRGPERG